MSMGFFGFSVAVTFFEIFCNEFVIKMSDII